MKKNIQFSILICLILGSFYCYPVSAQTIKFTDTALEVEQNSDFSLTLKTEPITDLFGLMFNINFDPKFLSFESAVEDDFLSSDCKTSFFVHENSPGKLTVGLSRIGTVCGGVSGSGDIITFNFKSLNKTGDTTLEFYDNRFCILENKECNWINRIWESVIVDIIEKQEIEEDVIVLGVEHKHYSDLTSLSNVKNEIAETISQSEAETIYNNNQYIEMNEAGEKFYNKIIEDGADNFDGSVKRAIAYFIQNGTNTTKRLGAGERTGVLSSYFAAFNKFPQDVADWQDVIKISNGRWPSQKNQRTENNAEAAFKKIYKRNPNMADLNDNAAVTIISYGLRPVKRNLENEIKAIATFKATYGYSPKSTEAWDIVRAIAYSGAKK